ncbi:MAG: hypothetical protein DRQ88_12245 [Epsilonproteobacteria bacterium]|nr:MAG: hypothetical protein DRQ88_12245 [Campylobacterota bacterium]RLA64256.1 MAG: hypothetical protein DRQ89_04670 [Campylobacterota bacterium]
MRKIFLFFLILLLPTLAISEEISAELTYFGPNRPIKMGSFISAKLLLGPKGGKYLKELENNVGKNLINGFYLQEVINPQVLQGGNAFLEADLILILISPIDSGGKNIWKVGAKSIPFNLKKFTGQQPDLNPKSFIILGQPVKKEWFYIQLGLALLALILLVMAYALWKRAKNKTILKEQKHRKKEKLKFWKDLIINAQKRSHFENLYEQREVWLALLPSLGDKTSSFFMVVDKHQYKPEWTAEELEEVLSSMEDIRRIVHGV